MKTMNTAICSKTDGARDYHTKSDKDKTLWYHLHGISKIANLSTNIKRLMNKKTYGYQGEKGYKE